MVWSVLGSTSVAASTGLVPLGNGNDAPEYPRGTVIIENTGETAVTVSVTVTSEEYESSREPSVSGGETLIMREFVRADEGDILTLAALLGTEGDPVEFEVLPAGGETEDTPQKSLGSQSRMLWRRMRHGVQQAENKRLKPPISDSVDL